MFKVSPTDPSAMAIRKVPPRLGVLARACLATIDVPRAPDIPRAVDPNQELSSVHFSYLRHRPPSSIRLFVHDSVSFSSVSRRSLSHVRLSSMGRVIRSSRWDVPVALELCIVAMSEHDLVSRASIIRSPNLEESIPGKTRHRNHPPYGELALPASVASILLNSLGDVQHVVDRQAVGRVDLPRFGGQAHQLVVVEDLGQSGTCLGAGHIEVRVGQTDIQVPQIHRLQSGRLVASRKICIVQGL